MAVVRQPCRCDLAGAPATLRRDVDANPPRQAETLVRDRQLVERWQTGDSAAGEELLGNYRDLFYRTCRRFGRNDDDDILDAWHELVVHLLTHLPSLIDRVQSSFAGYLVWQARAILKRAARPRERVNPLVDEPPAVSAAPDLWDAIRHCWDQLPPREHAVFELRYLRGLSLAEAADELHSNANAVAQSVHRLSRRMRACLAAAGVTEALCP